MNQLLNHFSPHAIYGRSQQTLLKDVERKLSVDGVPQKEKQPLDLENAKLIIERRWQVLLEVVILGICRLCHYFPASIQILFADTQLFLA